MSHYKNQAMCPRKREMNLEWLFLSVGVADLLGLKEQSCVYNLS